MASKQSSGRFEVKRNGKLDSILNPFPPRQRDGGKNDNLNNLHILAEAAVHTIARQEAARQDATQPNSPSDTPKTAPVVRSERHKPPRRVRYSLDAPGSPRPGPWLRRRSQEFLDKHYPLDGTTLEQLSRRRSSSSVSTLSELDPVPAPALVADPVPAPIVRRGRPHSAVCGVDGCTLSFSSKNIADHRKSHLFEADGGSEQARQPCKACTHTTGKPCMVSTNPTSAEVNTYSCLACLKSHRGCSHKQYGRIVPRPRRHPALDSPSH